MSHAAALGCLEHLAGRVEGDQFDRHAKAFRQLAGEIDGDAGGIAVRPLLRQHDVALVDRGAQRAGGGESFTTSGDCARVYAFL